MQEKKNKKYFIFLFGISLILLLFFGCINNSSESKLPEYTKDAIEAKPIGINEEDNKTNPASQKNQSKYLQILPEEDKEIKSNVVESDKIEINISNESEYIEKIPIKNITIKPKEIVVSIELDPKNGKEFSSFCKIDSYPLIIYKREEITNSIFTNAYYSQVYVSCGDKKRYVGENGLFRQTRICQINESGVIKQSLWLDEKECAYSHIIVLEPYEKMENICKLFEKKQEIDKFEHYYARVFISGFNKEDNIELKCLNKTISYKLVEFFPTTNNGFLYVSCENLPINEEKILELKVGEKTCGTLN